MSHDQGAAAQPTTEQLAAIKAAADAKAKADAAAAKQAEKDAAAKVKAEAKAKADADKVTAAAKKAEEKKAAADAKAAEAKGKSDAAQKKKDDAAATKQAAIDAKAAKAKEKTDAAAKAKADKEAARQPEQNNVRRPGPDGLCGKAWAVFDAESKRLGQPVTIGDALKVGEPLGLNAGNMRTEYARWKKFFGLSGPVAKPAAPATTAPAAQGATA